MTKIINNNIALITDFGSDGQHYVACMKGVILEINSTVKIIDISHNITPFSILEGAYILNSTYKYFPKGTIFVAVIDPGVGSARKIIILETSSGFYFVGPDNGLFTHIINNEDISKIIEISNQDYFLEPVSDTFHGRDIMAPVSAYLSKGISIENFGNPLEIDNIIKLNDLSPKIIENEKIIEGKIQYIDSFGNCITNIELDNENKSKNLGIQFLHKDSYKMNLKGKDLKFIFLSYYEELSSYLKMSRNPLLKRDSFNFLELSLNMKSFAQTFNISVGEIFYIKKDQFNLD